MSMTGQRAGKALVAAVFVLGALGVTACSNSSAQPRLVAQEASTDGGITALIKRQADAWAKGDAKGYADTFTAEGDLVLFSGDHLKGRHAIEIGMAHYLSTYLRGTRLRYEETLSVDRLDPDTVIRVTRGCVLRAGETACAASDRSTQLNVFHREGGTWKYAGFQNTRYEPLPA